MVASKAILLLGDLVAVAVVAGSSRSVYYGVSITWERAELDL